MTLTNHLLFVILALHCFSDFVLQTTNMALGKSKSNYWLGLHVSVYTLPFFLLGWKYALVNAAAHFCVDYVTSRINARLWDAKSRWFWTGIGVDQYIHACVLIYTVSLMKLPYVTQVARELVRVKFGV